MNSKDSKQLIKQTIADYNLISAKFSSTRRILSKDLHNLAGLIPANSKVLDYGCGNGRMSQLFHPDNYLGVDPSSELIKIAKKLHAGYNFRLIEAGEEIKEKFDAVLSLAVIHHLPDRKSQLEFLNVLKSSLKPGGMLILTSWNITDNPNDCGNILHRPFKDGNTEIDRLVYAFSLDELKLLVAKTGLKITSSCIKPRNRGVYSNLEIIATNS